MKKQNPDIPFVAQAYYHKATIAFASDGEIDTLILDPRGLLICETGAYYYISKASITNAARALRDNLKLSHRTKEICFTRFGATIDSELGQAIETMTTEIKTLQKKCEGGDSHTTDSS
jgi:hypothetical protein